MIGFFIPLRNKAAHVERAVMTALDQTYPAEVFVSDQGSTDGSLEIVKRITHPRLHILQCPHTEYKGMKGLNTHFNWMHEQIDCDYVICAPADDFYFPNYAERAMAVFDEFDPDLILSTSQRYTPELEYLGSTAFPMESRFITARECIERLVSGSSGNAWKHSFYQKMHMHGIAGPDVILGPMACVLGGCYYLCDPLSAYVNHADPDNTGLEGVARAEGWSDEIIENMRFQQVAAYTHILRLIEKYEIRNQDAVTAVAEAIVNQAAGWADVRTEMTLARKPVREFRV